MDRKKRTDSIFAVIFGFVLGVLLASFIETDFTVAGLAVLIGISVLVAEKLRTRGISREILFISLVFVSLGLGILRYEIKDSHIPIEPTSTGIVISESEQKENTTRFVFRADNGEKVLVNTDLYSSVGYGDRVEISGKLSRPGLIESEDGLRVFDYGKYLAKDDIYHTMSFTDVETLSGGHGHPVKSALLKIKKSFTDNIKEILAEPHAGLLSGLIVSGKDAMPKNLLDEFRRAGIIHIVVLSGYNITIIAEFIRRFFQGIFLVAKTRFALPFVTSASILAILGFVLMTGAEATVVRASIMVLIVILAKAFGKSYSASRALLLAGALMLVHNPKILVFDPSFQLSFLATLGLIHGAPLIEKYLKLIPEKLGFRMIVSTTLATQLFVLPLLVYSMGDFSLVSILANLLVLVVVPLTMLVGFLAATVVYVSSFLALPLAYVAHLLLAWILWVSSTLGNLSLASIPVPPIPFWVLIIIYALIFIIFRRSRGLSQHSPS